ncbi:MAG: DUF3891 family protein, partial [Acidobacteriales bacterium]|nr:DUF3891 family protein [Terriglobales bacterium]
MVVRSEEPLAVREGEHNAWELVNETQKRRAKRGWLIPQPAHSALSGEMAKHLSPAHFPGLTEAVVRAIALHDTGWSLFDAEQVASRNTAGFVPTPFIEERPQVFLSAWTGSIDVVERIGAAEGYMVSRHFASLGKEPSASYGAAERESIEGFQQSEEARQERLLAASGVSKSELEALLQANRFCDLLSLFLCVNLEFAGGAVATFSQRAVEGAPYRLGFDGG